MTLQLTIAGTGLACSAASGHLLSLAGEVTDQFRKGRFLEFMDLSHMASWTQVWRVLQATQIGAMLSDAARKGGSRQGVRPH